MQKGTDKKNCDGGRDMHVLTDTSLGNTIFLAFLLINFSTLYNYQVSSKCLTFFPKDLFYYFAPIFI